jgi:hypothetical protein
MNVTRFGSAPEYFPDNHFSMRCVRLQGHEAGESDALWLGVSTIQPGGYTSFSGSVIEKHYVVLSGELTRGNAWRYGGATPQRFLPSRAG